MALMWPLQQVSRIEEFEPPMGTAQDVRVVGGAGMGVDVQDILGMV
jgi:hypothetical protein